MSKRPKRPLSAYMLWLCSARARIKAQNPGIKATEIAKIGGQIWRNMTDKREWQEKAQRLRDQYNRDLEQYKARRANSRERSRSRSRRRRGRRALSLSSGSCSYDDYSD